MLLVYPLDVVVLSKTILSSGGKYSCIVTTVSIVTSLLLQDIQRQLKLETYQVKKVNIFSEQISLQEHGGGMVNKNGK